MIKVSIVIRQTTLIILLVQILAQITLRKLSTYMIFKVQRMCSHSAGTQDTIKLMMNMRLIVILRRLKLYLHMYQRQSNLLECLFMQLNMLSGNFGVIIILNMLWRDSKIRATIFGARNYYLAQLQNSSKGSQSKHSLIQKRSMIKITIFHGNQKLIRILLQKRYLVLVSAPLEPQGSWYWPSCLRRSECR